MTTPKQHTQATHLIDRGLPNSGCAPKAHPSDTPFTFVSFFGRPSGTRVRPASAPAAHPRVVTTPSKIPRHQAAAGTPPPTATKSRFIAAAAVEARPKNTILQRMMRPWKMLKGGGDSKVAAKVFRP
eukprot:1190854-Prorocentrum_minimum.AAC.3